MHLEGLILEKNLLCSSWNCGYSTLRKIRPIRTMTSRCLLTCEKYLQNQVKELKKKKKENWKGFLSSHLFFLLLKDNLLLGSYHSRSSRTMLMTTQGENTRSPSGANMKTVLQFKGAWPVMLALNKLTTYHKLINSTLWSLKCQLFSLISSFIGI